LPFPSSQLGILRNKPYAYVFAAVRATREAAYGDLFLASINVSENARFLVRLNDSNTAGRVAFYSRRADASTSSSLVVANYFASTSTFVISAASLWATSDGWLRKDGVEVASSTSWTTDGNTPDANSAYVTIGANAGTSVYMDATLGDFLIYTPSTAMATEDIEAIESWLATRAGL
jgi:hypothetical protein